MCVNEPLLWLPGVVIVDEIEVVLATVKPENVLCFSAALGVCTKGRPSKQPHTLIVQTYILNIDNIHTNTCITMDTCTQS